MFLDGELEVSPAIIVTAAGDSKYAARLFFQAGADESGSGERPLVGKIELFYIVRDAIKKMKVVALIKNSDEGLLNEVSTTTDGCEDPLESRPVQFVMAVSDHGLSDCGREVKKIGRD